MARTHEVGLIYRWLRLLVWCALWMGATAADAYWDESFLNASQFTGYKPMYVLWGAPDAKLQLSLKARVVEAWDFYFAYTQLMLWNLQADSHPFHDLNFNPSFFHRWRPFSRPESWLDTGYEHESNGLAGADSREWERLFILFSDATALGGPFSLQGSFKAWVPFKYDRQNPDMARYRGLCELNLTLANPFGNWWQGSDLTFRFYPAGSWYFDPSAGGQELTLRLKAWDTPYLPKITLQVFHGYGEYLIDYNRSHWRGYLGLAF